MELKAQTTTYDIDGPSRRVLFLGVVKLSLAWPLPSGTQRWGMAGWKRTASAHVFPTRKVILIPPYNDCRESNDSSFFVTQLCFGKVPRGISSYSFLIIPRPQLHSTVPTTADNPIRTAANVGACHCLRVTF